MWYRLVKNLFFIIFKIFLRLEVIGLENIPKTGPVVIASNHASLLDPPLIGSSASRQVYFMAKEELFVPIFGQICASLGAFPVKRGEVDLNAMKHALQILKNKKVLGIFPEGTRSKTGALGHAEPGALAIANKGKALVVPTAVIGSNLSLRKTFWPKVKVVFGEPLVFSEGRMNKVELEENSKILMGKIQMLLEKNKI